MKLLQIFFCVIIFTSGCSDRGSFTTVEKRRSPISTSDPKKVDEIEIIKGPVAKEETKKLSQSEDVLVEGQDLPELALGDCLNNPRTEEKGLQLEQGHDKLFLVRDQERSFCELLLASGHDTAVVQYLPEDCDGCELKIQTVSWAVIRSAYRDKIAHFVVGPKANPELEEKIKKFITDNGIEAILVSEPERKISSEIAKHRLLAEDPLLITANARLEYDYIQNSEALYLKIVDLAETTHLALESSAVMSPADPGLDWLGETIKTTGVNDLISITQFNTVKGE